MVPMAVREAFTASPLLSGCDPEALSPAVRRYPAGAAVTDEDAGEACVGLVAEGLVDVWSVAVDGNGVLLSALRRGDCFGISNLLRGGGMETRLRAATAVTVVCIPKAKLEAAFAADSRLAMRYAAICNEKIQFLLRRIALLTAQTTRGRLISWLLLHAEEDGRVASTLTRTDLAAALSVSRAALYRELNALRDANCLRLTGDCMTVTDRAGMEAMLRA